jgi:Bacterial PH domain
MSTLRASHEHDLKAQRGLPEPLPAGEHILWQGSPDERLLARYAFHTRKLAVYFGLLLSLRGAFVLSDTADWWLATKAVLWVLPVFAAAWIAIFWLARLSARTSVYTITDKRVVMRVGIVLSLSFNLPFKQIEGAGLSLLIGDAGDISLVIAPPARLAYLNFWPHVRPWQIAAAQPMLRCIADVSGVAKILMGAWAAATEHGASVIQASATRLPENLRSATPRTPPVSTDTLASAT